MKKKGIAPLVSSAYGTAIPGHSENVWIRNVPWTNIYPLLTLTAISLPSNFQEWKAVRISNYTETFPLCTTAHSRISAHYTNSSDVLVRALWSTKCHCCQLGFLSGRAAAEGDEGMEAAVLGCSPLPRLPKSLMPLLLHPHGVFWPHKPPKAGLFWDDRAFLDTWVHLANREWAPSTQGSVARAKQASDPTPGLLRAAPWCQEVHRDKQGWRQVKLTPKDQTAASQGKYMPT